MLMLIYDSKSHSGVKLWTVIAQRKEVESFALQQLDCVECKMHRCTVLLKDKIVINDTIIRLVEIARYPSNTVD